MKKFILAASILALAACGQPAEAPEAEAPEAPPTALAQLQSRGAEEQPVFAYQQLVAYQQANPEVQPACSSIRGAEARGVIPENIAPDSIYAPYVGSTVFAIQCGPQLTTVQDDPREHWLVVFTPGAEATTVVNCAQPNGRDPCRGRQLPTVEAP